MLVDVVVVADVIAAVVAAAVVDANAYVGVGVGAMHVVVDALHVAATDFVAATNAATNAYGRTKLFALFADA